MIIAVHTRIELVPRDRQSRILAVRPMDQLCGKPHIILYDIYLRFDKIDQDNSKIVDY